MYFDLLSTIMSLSNGLQFQLQEVYHRVKLRTTLLFELLFAFQPLIIIMELCQNQGIN